MDAGVKISRGKVSAHFTVPRWLLGVILGHVLTFLTFAGYTWAQLQLVKGELADCKAKISAVESGGTGD